MKKIIFLCTYSILSLVIASTLVFSPFAVPVPKAKAGGLGGGALEVTQQSVRSNTGISAIQNTTTAAASTLTAGATTETFIKENLLDGIGWAIAKQVVNSMTASLINWINSGFQGSPTFITDLDTFLLDALDSVAGTYIKSLGGIGEFICSPFKLDIQAALSINYGISRSGMPSGPSACTLTGIGNNIEDFLEGSMSGWDQWFEVTANPQNTPYGAYLEAEAKLNARLVNEAGQEIELASWGDGFLSNKICEAVEGSSGGEHCIISTPGKVISEALTFQLSTGPRALIEADEINEIIGALMNQLVQQAVGGINGLLGLGGSDYTDYSYGDGDDSFITSLEDESVISTTTSSSTKLQMDQQLATEESFLTLIDDTILKSNAIIAAAAIAGTAPDTAVVAAYSEASALRQSIVDNIDILETASLTYDGAEAASTTTLTADDIRYQVVVEYTNLYQLGVFTSITELEDKRTKWGGVLGDS